MFEINYSQLIQYEILEKLVTYIGYFILGPTNIIERQYCPKSCYHHQIDHLYPKMMGNTEKSNSFHGGFYLGTFYD